jgi:KUP system potassium uptake protein
MAGIRTNPPVRLPGIAVVLGRLGQGVPLALSQNLRLNHVLYEKVFLVSVEIAEIPRVGEGARADVTPIGDGLSRVALHFGFMEHPHVPRGLATAAAQGKIELGDPKAITYYAGHETIIAQGRSTRMSRWRESIFAFMHRNAQRPGAYFMIPCAQLMEVGVEFEI